MAVCIRCAAWGGVRVTAYYNEFDKKAAAWLRELIKQGHIAAGDVDERSIEDVRPNDLIGYAQCHFFAGIGGWSLALRRAGWSDDRPVWTGSCPCQPFSSAGAGAGFADERHLWPAFFHLISQRKPESVLGEQVASKDADAWIDLVHTDMEAVGYAFGAVAFPSAGVGAPHIRDRTYWVGHSRSARSKAGLSAAARRHEGVAGIINDSGSELSSAGRRSSFAGVEYGGMANTESSGRSRQCLRAGAGLSSDGAAQDCIPSGMADANSRQCDGIAIIGGNERNRDDAGREKECGQPESCSDVRGTGAINGFWCDADWLGCRDGKWRPVEPGTFPLANGVPGRVGLLRGYGNAINVEAASAFIEAGMSALA